MTGINIDENKLKDIFKTAIMELLQEQKEVTDSDRTCSDSSNKL